MVARSRSVVWEHGEDGCGAASPGLTGASLERLNRTAVSDQAEIRRLLRSARKNGTHLAAGMDSRNNPRVAQVVNIAQDELFLRGSNLEFSESHPLYFSFEQNGATYFFVAVRCAAPAADLVGVRIPRTVYKAERRSLPRRVPTERTKRSVELTSPTGARYLGELRDQSYQGLGVALDGSKYPPPGTSLTVRYPSAGPHRQGFAIVRHADRVADDSDLVKLGLSFSRVPYGPKIRLNDRSSILAGSQARHELGLLGALAVRASRRFGRKLGFGGTSPPVAEVVEYPDQEGHIIRALVDSTGSPGGDTAVIIPPAWGRTKETLLPLARTLVATFAANNRALRVVRFDGVNRRGESHVDPSSRKPGLESTGFTFSQGVRDILATIDFLDRDPSSRPAKIVLVTFSLASVEGRRVAALNPKGRLSGWVSVVGMADLQSGLRAVSGGIDYGYGLAQGVGFGQHCLGGVLIDMDNAGRDVLLNGFGYLEDARRDMAQIEMPVTWIHGKNDGWIDVERVREVMSAGTTERRRLIEVPTGHQLRTSRQALATFQLIAQEAAEMALECRIQPELPDLDELERQRSMERSRLPSATTNLRDFWQQYLLGEDGRVGIEFLTATSAYRDLMTRQVRMLRLRPGQTVLDLGSGVGDFGAAVSRLPGLRGVMVVAIDYVEAALLRGRSRFASRPDGPRLGSAVADLGGAGCGVPVAAGSVDAVLASLLLGYLPDPEVFLDDVRRVLRPGGRLVLSTPVADADLSKVYTDGLRELDPLTVRSLFGDEVESQFDSLQRGFLNLGARLLDLEEQGLFSFWEPDVLSQLVRRAGFRDVEISLALGSPPQASVVAATRA